MWSLKTFLQAFVSTGYIVQLQNDTILTNLECDTEIASDKPLVIIQIVQKIADFSVQKNTLQLLLWANAFIEKENRKNLKEHHSIETYLSFTRLNMAEEEIPGGSLLWLWPLRLRPEMKWRRSNSWKIPLMHPICLWRSWFSSLNEWKIFADIFTSSVLFCFTSQHLHTLQVSNASIWSLWLSLMVNCKISKQAQA